METKTFQDTRVQSGDPGYSLFRTPDGSLLTNTKISVADEEASIYGVTARNPNGAAAYIQVYDVTAAAVAVGTTTPVRRILVPANGEKFIQIAGKYPWHHFNNAIVIAAVTGDTDASSSAPASPLYVEIQYRK